MSKMTYGLNTKLKANIYGQLAIVIWSLAASCAVFIANIPLFEVLTGLFFSGFIGSVYLNTKRGNWHLLKSRPLYIIIAGILGIVGNDICYFMAFKYAPAVHVDLIICLWPIIVFILSAFLLKEKIGAKHLIASMIAFYAIYLLLTEKEESIFFQEQYIIGYLAAFGAVFFWCFYMIASRYYNKNTPELFAIYCGFGTIISIIMHLFTEETVILSIQELLVIIILGALTHGLAYYGWDYGIKKGNFIMLSILSYFIPVLSILALISFGFAEMTSQTIISTSMILLASLIGSVNAK